MPSVAFSSHKQSPYLRFSHQQRGKLNSLRKALPPDSAQAKSPPRLGLVSKLFTGLANSIKLAAHNLLLASKKRIKDIRCYYYDIDHLDYKDVLKRFAEDAVYEREGWKPMKGKAAIADFFENKRKLRGFHLLKSIQVGRNYFERLLSLLNLRRTVYVEGYFISRQKEKYSNLKFTDLWRFDKHNKVIFRKSWISTPGV